MINKNQFELLRDRFQNAYQEFFPILEEYVEEVHELLGEVQIELANAHDEINGQGAQLRQAEQEIKDLKNCLVIAYNRCMGGDSFSEVFEFIEEFVKNKGLLGKEGKGEVMEGNDNV